MKPFTFLWYLGGLLIAYTGALMLWELAMRYPNEETYMMPFAIATLPRYVAGDYAVLLVILGFFVVIIGRLWKR